MALTTPILGPEVGRVCSGSLDSLWVNHRTFLNNFRKPARDWRGVTPQMTAFLKRRAASCFWWAVSHVVTCKQEFRDLTQAFEGLFDDAVSYAEPVNVALASQVCRGRLSVYCQRPLEGNIEVVVEGPTEAGVLFVFHTTLGSPSAHWLPVLSVRSLERVSTKREMAAAAAAVAEEAPRYADALRDACFGPPVVQPEERPVVPTPVLDSIRPVEARDVQYEEEADIRPICQERADELDEYSQMLLVETYVERFSVLCRLEMEMRQFLENKVHSIFFALQAECRSDWRVAYDLECSRAKLFAVGEEPAPLHRTSKLWSPLWIATKSNLAHAPINSLKEVREQRDGVDGWSTGFRVLREGGIASAAGLVPRGRYNLLEWLVRPVRDVFPRMVAVQEAACGLPARFGIASDWVPAYGGAGFSQGSMIELRAAVMVGEPITVHDSFYVRVCDVDVRDHRLLSNGCYNPRSVVSITTTSGSSWRLKDVRIVGPFDGASYYVGGFEPVVTPLLSKVRQLNPWSWEVVESVACTVRSSTFGACVAPTVDAKYRFEYGMLAEFISRPLKGHFLDARNEEFGLATRSGVSPLDVFVSMESEYQAACERFGVPGFDIH